MIGAKLCPAPRGRPPGSIAFRDRPYREIAGFAKWVMLSGLLFAVHMRTDILLLGTFRTEADVGYYSIAWNLMLFLDLITSSIVAALLPAASKLKAADERADFWSRTVAVSALVAVALCPLYFFSDTIIATLFPKYLPAVGPFHILFWSSIIMLMIYPLYLDFYAQIKPARVSVTYGILMLVSVVAGLIIIPRYGLLGAARMGLVPMADCFPIDPRPLKSPGRGVAIFMAAAGTAMASLLALGQPWLYLAVIPGITAALAILRSPVLGLYLIAATLPLDAGRGLFRVFACPRPTRPFGLGGGGHFRPSISNAHGLSEGSRGFCSSRQARRGQKRPSLRSRPADRFSGSSTRLSIAKNSWRPHHQFG
jgi:Polysaccharide biosynthesis protein